jgi:hypothetical protein
MPRKLLALVKPPKPISQMTEAERHAFAKQVADLAGERLGESPAAPRESPPPPRGRTATV